MSGQIEWVALSVFIFFFALVTVMGFFAARWKSGPVSEHLDEWGLGGRQFGTWITWFLRRRFYTAYTVIAVPALVYAVGAYGFFGCPIPSSSIPLCSQSCRCCERWRTPTAMSPRRMSRMAPTIRAGLNWPRRSPAWSRPCPISRCS